MTILRARLGPTAHQAGLKTGIQPSQWIEAEAGEPTGEMVQMIHDTTGVDLHALALTLIDYDGETKTPASLKDACKMLQASSRELIEREIKEQAKQELN